MDVFEKCTPGKVYIYCTMNTNFYIGALHEIVYDKVFVRKCHILAVQPQGNNAMGLNFVKMPGEFLGEMLTHTALDRSQIAYVVTPKADIAAAYMQMTSGIVPAGSGAMPPLPGAHQMFNKS